MANEFVTRKGIKSLGGVTFPHLSITSGYTITENDYMVEVESGTVTVTLPSAVGIDGKIYIIKNSGTGVVTIDTTSSQLIDNLPTYNLAFYDTLTVVSDNVGWNVIEPQTKQLIRVYNNSGSIITKGSACNIVSSYNSIPVATLANAGAGKSTSCGTCVY